MDDTVDAMTSLDRMHLDAAITAARRSRENGNHPFGAVLADPDGTPVLTAENAVVTEWDATAHAELFLVRRASRTLAPSVLAGSTLYSSAEPCAMCAGAIYWAGIGRVVYALSEVELKSLTGAHDENPTMALPCREVFARGQRDIRVVGPVPNRPAVDVHSGFWG